MKKTIYIKAIALLLAGGTLTGCSDFLEPENKSLGEGNDADGFFSNNPGALLTSSYINLKKFNNQADITDQGTDLYMNTRGADPGAFNQYASLNAENTTVRNYYVNCYGTINTANGVLHYTEGNAGQEKMRQEARFLRAYAYYCLTQQFGGVPYITEYIQSANRNYPRTDLGALYQGLANDLEDVYNNCQLDAADYTSGKPSKEAVAALLAKIYLAWGWDLDTQLTDAATGTYTKTSTEHFALAAQWAERAINGISLTQSFATKWAPTNENNNEFIWGIPYDVTVIEDALEKECNAQAGTYGGYYGTNQKGCNSLNQQSEKSMYLFEEGDTRYEGTFMTTFYQGNTDDDAYYAPYNTPAADLDQHNVSLKFFPYWVSEEEAESWLAAHQAQLVKGSFPNTVKAAILTAPNVTFYTIGANGAVTRKTSQTLAQFNSQTDNGVCVRKFDDPVNKANCFRDIVLLNRSEIYLVAAEANLMADNATGFWKYLNAVRQRAGVATLNSINDYNPAYTVPSTFGNITLLDLLLDERGRECYAEKTRFADLRRTKQLVRYNLAFNNSVSSIASMTGADGGIKWLRPIPSTELNKNDGINAVDQNPGYRSSDTENTEGSQE
ncbi:MAG: RagB/SusD family nutrient uptake outer membrane protein [Prevotella sp.]|nr:RagB/SusD family nutrient uptake outer membrane protein [Prevotella sp.]